MATIAGLLVLAAFVLATIVILVSVTQRRRSMAEVQETQHAMQLAAPVDVIRAFETLQATRESARRTRLAREQRIRSVATPAMFCLSGLSVVCALAAWLFAGDAEAAIICAMMAATTVGYSTMAYLSAKRARHRAAD